MSAVTKPVKDLFLGRKVSQRFFRWLFDISIEGMNIGTGGRNLKENGEFFAIKYVLDKEQNPVIFDVGAQGGNYIKEILDLSKNRALVYAFEPVSRDYDTLHSMFGNRITSVKSALGKTAGEAMIHFPDRASGLASLHKPHEGFDKSEQVSIETIDNFCVERDVKSITLLKLDVEGHELACLEGAKQMLPNIKYIQFEFSAASRDARVYFRDIFNLLSDYRIYRILKNGLYEISAPEKITELLFTTNYFAERKEL